MGFQLSMLSSQNPNELSSRISYTEKQVLGGLQGSILHANFTFPNGTIQQVAVKVWNEGNLKEDCELERQLLTKLQGTKGIARLLSFPEADNHSDRLFLEWANEGDLFTLIERFQENTNPPIITNSHIHQILDQLLTSVEAINKLGYAHRDIKPENILVYSLTEDKIEIGLSDFGLVVPLNVRTGVAGTENYLPPACRKVFWHTYDGSEDLYGIGITVGIFLQFLNRDKFRAEIELTRLIKISKIEDIPKLKEKLKEQFSCPLTPSPRGSACLLTPSPITV